MNQRKKTDEELITDAYHLNYVNWHEIDSLMEQAESDTTKHILRRIQTNLYHREEASCGLL